VTKEDSAIYIYAGIQTMDIFMHELKEIKDLKIKIGSENLYIDDKKCHSSKNLNNRKGDISKP
tara:strand:+ start:313 stop:501 length:189 start_codon:yes stop_codon:yes gene_type:complete